jgi:hypothetical protein
MTYPSGETPKLDLLSVAIGAEFNECSIAAAELNKQVYAELDRKGTQQRVLYPIGDDPTRGQRFIIEEYDCYAKTETDAFKLALIRPANSLRGRRAVMRRAIEKSVDDFGTEPQLAAILGCEDAYVPLASFARRKGGTCSYVQLGSEMKDDNFFVTTADEGTSRQDIIETIRRIVAGTVKTDEPFLITSLLVSELLGKTTQLDKAMEAMTVRRIYERAKPKERATFKILDEKTGKFSQQDAKIHSLFSGLKMDDGRYVNLVLIQDEGANLQLQATTRGDIALTVASLDKAEGTIDLLGLEKDLPADQRREIISTLHHIILLYFKPEECGLLTCKQLNVASRLEAAIGPCSSNEELLFGKVWSMANQGGVFSAVASNVQLGKTRGDAKVNAEVQRDGTAYSVIIRGAPLAMPDEVPRPILRLDFDSTQPLIDRKKQTDPSVRAKDILDILNLF